MNSTDDLKTKTTDETPPTAPLTHSLTEADITVSRGVESGAGDSGHSKIAQNKQNQQNYQNN